MKKLLAAVCFVLWIIGPALTAIAADNIIRLNMTGQYMERHPVVQKIWLPWFEEIKQRTGGRVEITYYNPGAICPEGDIFDATRSGQVHIGQSYTARNQGRLPITVGFDIPSALTTPVSASAAIWRAYSEIPEIQKEFAGIKVLTMHSGGPHHICLAKGQPVTALPELAGKRILVATGDNARIVRALGANPMIVPTPDWYLSISRNMADGGFMAIPPLRSFKLDETLKNITVTSLLIPGFWIGMNQATWDSLPPEAKQAFAETCGPKLSQAIGGELHNADQQDSKLMAGNGMVFYTLPKAERQRWLAKVVPALKANWMEQMKQRKVTNAEQIYAKLQKIAEECEAKQTAQP